MRDSPSGDDHRMLRQVPCDETDKLIGTKTALRKLVEVYTRIDNLMAKKFEPHVHMRSRLLSQSSDKESIERDVRNLNEGLSTLIKVAMRRQKSFTNVLDMAKRFEESNSLEEISTLIGLTLLSDYRGHVDGLSQIAGICENKIYPSVPLLRNLMGFAGELDRVCKWTDEILQCDPGKGEDDIIRMVSAIKNHDLDSFNKIYERLDQRLGNEEGRFDSRS